MKTWMLALAVGVLGLVHAEDPKKPAAEDPWDAVTSRGKIEVEKLAFVEAKIKLAEVIKSLQFEPKRVGGVKVTIGELAAEHESIQAVIKNMILKNVQPVGEAKFLPNLTCEVKTGVLMRDVIDLVDHECKLILSDLREEPQVNAKEIKKLASYNFQYLNAYYQDENNKPLPIVYAVGSAKTPESYIRHTTNPPPKVLPPVPDTITPPAILVPAWAKQTFSVTGSNPQERTALLAAQYEAMLKIHAIVLDEKTTLGDILATQPKARGAVCDFLSASPVNSAKKPDGATMITLTLSLEKFYPLVKDFLPSVVLKPD